MFLGRPGLHQLQVWVAGTRRVTCCEEQGESAWNMEMRRNVPSAEKGRKAGKSWIHDRNVLGFIDGSKAKDSGMPQMDGAFSERCLSWAF